MKITLKELRSIVRESVRSHLKETERRDLSNQEGPFIGSDVSREASTNEKKYIFKVLSIFQKYASTAPGDRAPAIHHYATIDSYPNGLRRDLEPYLNAKQELDRLSPGERRRNPTRVRELNRTISSMGRDIGNLKRLAIGELAEELGLVPEEVLELRAAQTALGLSGGLTLNNLAGIAKEADEELSSNDKDMSIEDLMGN
jgi:hypothetical protein